MSQAMIPTIKRATVDMATEMAQVVNWAYRGKEGTEGWTGEKHLINGIRISVPDLEDLLRSQEKGQVAVFAAVLDERIIGTIKAERLAETEAEFGLFSVDPSLQSNGIGRRLLDHAEAFAKSEWHATKGVMCILDQRDDLFKWYSRRGYTKTGRKLPFPEEANCGTPKTATPLQFDVIERPLLTT